jgi:hypothetical protein
MDRLCPRSTAGVLRGCARAGTPVGQGRQAPASARDWPRPRVPACAAQDHRAIAISPSPPPPPHSFAPAPAGFAACRALASAALLASSLFPPSGPAARACRPPATHRLPERAIHASQPESPPCAARSLSRVQPRAQNPGGCALRPARTDSIPPPSLPRLAGPAIRMLSLDLRWQGWSDVHIAAAAGDVSKLRHLILKGALAPRRRRAYAPAPASPSVRRLATRTPVAGTPPAPAPALALWQAQEEPNNAAQRRLTLRTRPRRWALQARMWTSRSPRACRPPCT